MGTFLSQEFNASGGQLALAYETQSIGAIIAPFVVGLIADRYFEAQKILGILHIIGASLLYMASNSASFSNFYPYIFQVYPSLVLTATIFSCTINQQVPKCDKGIYFGRKRLFIPPL